LRLSASEARRAALAAQGFDRPRPGGDINARHFRRIVDTLGLLQLDFVNVLVPAHYLVLWSRLGAYERARLDHCLSASGAYTEQWAHEASVVPTDTWPLLEHRRRTFRPWKSNPLGSLDDPGRYLDEVLEQVRRNGPLTASDLPAVDGPKRRAGEWHRSIPRWALELHFGRGRLAVAGRQPNFQRLYDLPERIIPAAHLGRAPAPPAARRRLLRRAAAALGVASAGDLADYYRMRPRDAAPRIEELVEEGTLRRVRVDGWDCDGFLHHAARIPARIDGRCLLSPFDPLVWYRPRLERLFGFHYRIEIYVPAARRRWGYYVLPFRRGDTIVARVDLKADRNAGALLVQRAHLESGENAARVADDLAAELRELADWLGLERVSIRSRTDFAREIGRRTCLNHRAQRSS
jgi:uncharacterized protein YcaQ